MGCSKNSSEREVYSNTSLPQETRKTSNKQLDFTPKATRKGSTKISKVSRRQETIEIIAEENKENNSKDQNKNKS